MRTLAQLRHVAAAALFAAAAPAIALATDFQVVVTGQVSTVSAGAPTPLAGVAVGDPFTLTLQSTGLPFPGLPTFASYAVDADAGQLEIGGSVFTFADGIQKITATSGAFGGSVGGGARLLTPAAPGADLSAGFSLMDPASSVITTAFLDQLIGTTIVPGALTIEASVTDNAANELLTVAVAELRILDEPCEEVGSSYCTATPNSAGTEGRIVACGSTAVSDGDLTLTARRLPASVTGIFAASRTQDLVPLAGGSQGNLCLGGVIGRFVGPQQILDSGTAGRFSLAVDLGQIPEGSAPVAALPGETWNFTAWYRDTSGGAMTSNFTDAVSVTFQ